MMKGNEEQLFLYNIKLFACHFLGSKDRKKKKKLKIINY